MIDFLLTLFVAASAMYWYLNDDAAHRMERARRARDPWRELLEGVWVICWLAAILWLTAVVFVLPYFFGHR